LKKVALIAPGKCSLKCQAVQEPLNLGYLAAYLEKNNIDVIIIDELANQNVKKEIEKFQPDIVGITATTPVVTDGYRIADMCREMGILTVMGGVHPSVMSEEALKHSDIVVKGEGEIALLDIVEKDIKSGIIIRPHIKNIDEIPPPARHLMQMEFYLYTKDRYPDSYLYFVPPRTKTGELVTSRGCPYSCTFCHNSWRGIPCRYNSAERVISEIKGLINDFGVGAIFFIEDNFFVNKPRLRKICKLIEENKIEIIWGANSRVDNIDSETIKIAKKSGCRQITFGVESGSQRILDVLNKRITVEQSRKAIKLCKEVGILVNATFMIGNPTETVEDIKLTQKFIMENDIDCPGLCITTPYPGTELWKWCEKRGLIPEKINWEDLTCFKVSIPACDTISPEKITELYEETNNMIIKNKIMKHPFRTIKETIKFPSRIPKGLKRILKIKK